MKRRKIILVLIILFFVGLGVLTWKPLSSLKETVTGTSEKTRTSKYSESPDPSHLGDTGLPNSSNHLRIISDITNSTGRVVTVEKDGRRAQVALQPGLIVSPEVLEALAFSEPHRPGRSDPNKILTHDLVFYGLAVDGESNVLSGVKVEANVLVVNPALSTMHKTFETISANDGRFSFNIPWGQQIVIQTGKTNYISPQVQSFQYGPVGSDSLHQPDANDPVVFVLYKKKEAEQLFSFTRVYRAAVTGEPLRIDLTTGDVTASGGDLVVSLFCSEPYTNLKKFLWKASFAVVNGGLIENNVTPMRLEYLPEAPATGYQPGFQIEYGPDTPTYRLQHDGMYYVQSRNGRVYAKMKVFISAIWDERGVPFSISAVVNTNASRYLHTEP